jgi:hypothetical protein
MNNFIRTMNQQVSEILGTPYLGIKPTSAPEMEWQIKHQETRKAARSDNIRRESYRNSLRTPSKSPQALFMQH